MDIIDTIGVIEIRKKKAIGGCVSCVRAYVLFDNFIICL